MEADPIAWLAVPDKHPVLDSAGKPAAYVAARLGDPGNGRFDGFVIGIDVPRAVDPRLMLEVEYIGDIDTDGVHTTLTATELAALPEYEPDQSWQPRLKRRKR